MQCKTQWHPATLQSFAYANRIQTETEYIHRKKIATTYDENLNWNYFTKQRIPENSTHVYHLYPILVPEAKVRDDCLEFLKDSNIFAQIHYPPISRMTGFKNYYSDSKNAEEIGSRVISLPMFPQMTDDEIDFVINKLNKFANNWKK